MTILFDGRFSTGIDFSTYYSVDPYGTPTAGGVAGAYELVDDPAGSGETVAMLTMVSGSPGRVELRPYETDIAGAGPVWGERWYAWWTYLPTSWVTPVSQSVDASGLSDTRVNFAQSHDTQDGGDTTHLPPWIYFIDQGGRYKILTTYDTNATTGSRDPNMRLLDGLPVVLGQWDLWVLHQKLAYNTDGFTHFYRNRRRIYSVTGTPTQYNDTIGPFFKSGLYSFFGSLNPASRFAYHKGIVIGDENSSHLEVSGLSALETAVVNALV